MRGLQSFNSQACAYEPLNEGRSQYFVLINVSDSLGVANARHALLMPTKLLDDGGKRSHSFCARFWGQEMRVKDILGYMWLERNEDGMVRELAEQFRE